MPHGGMTRWRGLSEGSGNGRGFFEKVTFEAGSEGWVSADQAHVGRGGREGETAFLARRAERQTGR